MEDIIQDDQYNIGHICTKMQCERGHSDKVAMRWISPDMKYADYTFGDLETQSNKFANVLQAIGLSRGDIIFTLLPKMPEQFFVLLGALKLQLIASPLNWGYSQKEVADNLNLHHSSISKILHRDRKLAKTGGGQ